VVEVVGDGRRGPADAAPAPISRILWHPRRRARTSGPDALGSGRPVVRRTVLAASLHLRPARSWLLSPVKPCGGLPAPGASSRRSPGGACTSGPTPRTRGWLVPGPT